MTDPSVSKCCVPSICQLKQVIRMDHLSDCIKVICNNEQCDQGRYMHKACFEDWEKNVISYMGLKGCGRSWSYKQRIQNVWSKKGYALAYKACLCTCKKGYLRKDLDWIPPVMIESQETTNKKKKKNRNKNDKPILTNSNTKSVTINNNNNNHIVSNNGGNQNLIPLSRIRTSSMSSTGSLGSGETPQNSPQVSPQISPNFGQVFFNKKNIADRYNCLFGKRIDFSDYSSFGHLPRSKINSYNIKMEDEVNHGHDETRSFVLSVLSAHCTNRISCIICETSLSIFGRYPLIDGTLFMSAVRHSPDAVECPGIVKRYLNAICMPCLDGMKVVLKCKGCLKDWNGSYYIYGTNYQYDILAATPCCHSRLRCNNCSAQVIPLERRLQFFSDYSRPLPCNSCGVTDYHFAKPLNTVFTRYSSK